MRSILAGLLVLCFSTLALAQVKGEVESIGFGALYRPNTWTPMVVRLIPETSENANYLIQIFQEDLDGDLPIFQKLIPLTGTPAGQPPRPQRYWVYFIPKPTKGGLPDTTRGGTLAELQKELRVIVSTEKGKPIAQLPITQSITSLDPDPNNGFSSRQGTKLVLAVSDGVSQPHWRDYQGAMGMMEEMALVLLRPSELPEDARAYEAVDAILWLNHNAGDIKMIEDDKLPAIQAYVRQGGRLIICQPAEWQKTEFFDEMLPVVLSDNSMRNRGDLDALRRLAANSAMPVPVWSIQENTFKIAWAAEKPNALVEEWIDWNEPNTPANRSPYLARLNYGLGSVTWVAQNLGDPSITNVVKTGWLAIWDRVFDWKNRTLVTGKLSEEQKHFYAPASGVDMGYSMLGGMDHEGKSAALVGLAVIFFIFYWIVAGPGIYLYLVSRGRSRMSWFFFGLSALAATAITVLLVKLVLRGDPEIRHLSIVRLSPNEPAVVDSRLGLYIPADGEQEIKLLGTADNNVSYITAFPMHPQHITGDTAFTANVEYAIPLRGATSDDPVAIEVPYRSTLKKMQAHWVGNLIGGIDGQPRILSGETIPILQGTLTNNTGHDLSEIYIAFRNYRPDQDKDEDWVLFFPSWPNGVSIDLDLEFKQAPLLSKDARPENGKPVKGVISQREWLTYWYESFKNVNDMHWDDSKRPYQRSFPMLSLFGRLPPARNSAPDRNERFELLRRGARQMDLSAAVSAGQMVVLGKTQGPLPFPMEVNDNKVEGAGTVYYQVVVSLDRSAVMNATTQPGATTQTVTTDESRKEN